MYSLGGEEGLRCLYHIQIFEVFLHFLFSHFSWSVNSTDYVVLFPILKGSLTQVRPKDICSCRLIRVKYLEQ
jgi:hypothetical protein